MLQCNFCGQSFDLFNISETRAKSRICTECQKTWCFCEICGTISPDKNPDTQLHYEEECFK